MSAMLTVAQVAGRLGAAPSVVRYYDDKGVVPATARDESGARLYDEAAVSELSAAVLLRRAGMPLAQVRRYLALRRADDPARREMTAALVQDLSACLAQLESLD